MSSADQTGKQPIYVVSGVHRSGTSCMMGCLIEGGMVGNYTLGKDSALIQAERLKHFGAIADYHPNPTGFYEGRLKPLAEARGMVTKGMLSKFFYHDPSKLPPTPVYVIIMRRSEDERRRSLQMWNYDEQELALRLEFDKWYDLYQEHMSYAKTWQVEYHDLVYKTEWVANRLIHDGWPITVEGFCSHVKPELHRNK